MLSIEPILAAAGIREMLLGSPAPVVAVSPIIDGAAVKGPTAKIFSELGEQVSAVAVANRYEDLLDGFILDQKDQNLVGEITSLSLATTAIPTLMLTNIDKKRLAEGRAENSSTRSSA